MSVLTKVKKLTDNLTTILEADEVRKAIGDDGLAAIVKDIEMLDKELANPAILGNVVRNRVTSFEEWDERVKGLVEYVRPDGSITEFEIQSLTAGEMKTIRAKRAAMEPVMPQQRNRGDGKGDSNDKHYQKDRDVYEQANKKLDDLNVLWFLEHGLLFEIAGKDDDEKLESLSNTVAGDAAKIASAIANISNLSPETMSPF